MLCLPALRARRDDAAATPPAEPSEVSWRPCLSRGCRLSRCAGAVLLLLAALAAAAADLPPHPVPNRLRVLIVTGGHGFDQEPFFAMFDRMPEILWGHAAYGGAAEKYLEPDSRKRYDVLLFYDMNQNVGPQVELLEQTLAEGKPAVFLHHAIGSYPKWTEYRDLVGGHANFGGERIPGAPNTKFFHDVWMHVRLAEPRHPITEGLRSFDIYDEAYKDVESAPSGQILLETDYADSDRAIAWTHDYKGARIVYLQLGHGPQSFSHPIFETLLRRSLLWGASRLEGGEQ